MSGRLFLIAALLGVFLSSPASVNAEDVGEAAQTIKNAYDEWVMATNAKDIDQWSRFLAPDAVFLPPGTTALETEEEIIGYYIELFKDPKFELDCEQTFVEVADSNDLAWARGVCRATFTTPDGGLGRGTSKWTKVWVRLKDGSWKCRLNTWNYDASN